MSCRAPKFSTARSVTRTSDSSISLDASTIIDVYLIDSSSREFGLDACDPTIVPDFDKNVPFSGSLMM